MTQENIDLIGQAETQFEQGYDDRWRDLPYRDDVSESWQRGWKEANLELSGDDSIEFLLCALGGIQKRIGKRETHGSNQGDQGCL